MCKTTVLTYKVAYAFELRKLISLHWLRLQLRHMARRKRQLLDDDDDSSASDVDDYNDPAFDANDPVAREERELFENPYGHKRRRKDGKDDAIYGVFLSDDEDEGSGGRKGGKGERRRDWAKAPAFVSGEKVDLDKTTDVEMKGEESGSEGGDEGGSQGDAMDEDSEPSRPPSPRVREEEEDEPEERPRFGGLGIGASKVRPSGTFSGFSRGGIGSSSKQSSLPPASASPSPGPISTEDLPTSFGSARAQRSFVRNGATSSGLNTPKPVPLNASERQHFSKLESSFGARMLAKMGWQAGTGLGTTGEGIVTPVESKLRPRGMGLAFKGFKEKTEQAKAEARRRGEVVSDDEERPAARKGRKAAKAQEDRTDAWKKPKKVKTRIEHKTYEQIIAEAGEEAPQAGLGQIIDATGATVS